MEYARPRELVVVLSTAAVMCLAGSAASNQAAPSQTVRRILDRLEGQIAQELSSVREGLPRNPRNAAQMQAKIAMLEDQGLARRIRTSRFWVEGNVRSASGRNIPVVAVYPVQGMREEALESVSYLASALPRLEKFMTIPWPEGAIQVWYGFRVGSRGGAGVLYMEDRGTYESRATVAGLPLPYHAINSHEMSHTYISNESLAQFLELYTYNLGLGSSPDVSSWSWTRNHIPRRSSNTGIHALLDIYQLIGSDAMSQAYAAIYRLRPPYGVPLSPEARRAFVDQAPAALKADVEALSARITQ